MESENLARWDTFPPIATYSLTFMGRDRALHHRIRTSSCSATRRPAVFSITLALVFLVLAASAPATTAAPIEHDAFHGVWERTDRPVAELEVDRTWTWGPEASSDLLVEEYEDAPDGERIVQYFDKSRMEINDTQGDPSNPWYVTNGLLARDLILGQVQVGDDAVETYDPPEINVAGDSDDPDGPTYQTYHDVMSDPALEEGSVITQTIDRSGNVESDDSLADHGVTAAYHEPATGHTVASVFREFMTSSGTVYQDGEFVSDQLFTHPYYATGYPLTEAYWATVRVDGEPREVLTQVFERRVLTYTPDNPDGWKVEAGNAGLHYYHWYYEVLDGNSPEEAEDPESPVESAPNEDEATCLDSFEQEFLTLINQYRQDNDLQPLENSAALNVASHKHSADMGERDYVNHLSPEGTEPWDRMADEGYDYNTRKAENIAAGYPSAQDVFDAWQDSADHNRTMLDSELDVIGIGRVEASESSYGVYWTTNFGGHVDAAPDC